MVFGEIWAQRTRGSLISIEEGMLEHWHFGRIVLAGDAVHEVDTCITPSWPPWTIPRGSSNLPPLG